MNHIITDEETKLLWDTYNSSPLHHTAALKEAITAVLANRPAPVATLRPIAEMPADLPKNCQAITGVLYNHAENPYFETDGAGIYGPCDHFVMFQLPTAPDPEADLRREFEEAVKQVKHEPNLTRQGPSYEDDEIADFYCLFKLAKGAKP